MKRSASVLFIGFFLLTAHRCSADDVFLSATLYQNQGVLLHLSNDGSGQVLFKNTFNLCGNVNCSSLKGISTSIVPMTGDQVAVLGLLQNVSGASQAATYETEIKYKPSINYIFKKAPLVAAYKFEPQPYLQSFQESPASITRFRMGFEASLSNGEAIRSVVFNPATAHYAGPTKDYISYDASDHTVGGGIDYHGTMSFGTVYKQNVDQTVDSYFYYRSIANGTPTGTDQELKLFHSIDQPTNYTIVGPSDLTAVIESSGGGKLGMVDAVPHRFLLYRTYKQSGSSYFSQVFLQPLNVQGSTLVLAGARKPLTAVVKTNLPGPEFLQTVAVDPNGTFAIYSIYNPTCSKGVLKSQKLDPNTGNKIGLAVTILGCTDVATSPLGVYGIDVIRK